MKQFPRAVWLLIGVSALTMSTGFMMVFASGLIGAELAPWTELATLPLALMVTGVALSAMPVGRAIQRWGRKAVIIGGALIAVCGSLLAALATLMQSFWLLCFAAVVIGSSMAVVQQYRFAMMEWVRPELRADVVSRGLLGGLVAAFVGPELAAWGQGWLAVPFVGSFILLAAVNFLAACLLLALPATRPSAASAQAHRIRWRELPANRPLVAAVLAGTVGYAVMSFLMTATPLHMHNGVGHSLSDTKWVIQSHILAMFLPSLISGALIRRYGLARMMTAGVMCNALSIAVALTGTSVTAFWLSLILLGVGWNFLFIAGTALLATVSEPEQAPRIQSLNDTFIFGAQAVASLSSGWVLHSLGWKLQLVLVVPLLVLMLVVIKRWRRTASLPERPQKTQEPAVQAE